MMITDEMVKKAVAAAEEYISFGDEIPDEAMRAVLEAVYPLIKEAVLEGVYDDSLERNLNT